MEHCTLNSLVNGLIIECTLLQVPGHCVIILLCAVCKESPKIFLIFPFVGQYQCFAKNKYGTAITNSVFVRKSELNNFKDEPPQTLVVNEGDPFGISCVPPDGWPKPVVYWMRQAQNWIKTINSSRYKPFSVLPTLAFYVTICNSEIRIGNFDEATCQF